MPSEYDRACEEYEWERAWDAFEGSEDGQYNIGQEIVGKHAERDDIAVRIIDFDSDEVEVISYAELHDLSSRVANFLEGRGLSQGCRPR